jgi:hypothetical protein
LDEADLLDVDLEAVELATPVTFGSASNSPSCRRFVSAMAFSAT